MTIIVAGHLLVEPEDRPAFLHDSMEAVRLARSAAGCQDFVVAADPLDPGGSTSTSAGTSATRWKRFAAGPDDELGSLIVSADVREFELTES